MQTTKLLLAFAVIAGALVLSACEKDEQDKKGVYGGKPDQTLTDEQRKALEQRSTYQRR